MTREIVVKQIRPDLGAVECRVVDIDNDRDILRDGDVAEIAVVNSTTYGEIIAACKAAVIANPGCENWFQ
jgi:hypothetical protein